MFSIIFIRPDITPIVGVVSLYMKNPNIEHWDATKIILRYVKGSSNDALFYGGTKFVVKGDVD